jgi:hypothetical protein
MANSMRFGCMMFRKRTDQPHPNNGHLWWHRTLPTLLLLSPIFLLIGCAGLVSEGGTKSQPGQQAAIQVTPGSFNFGNLVVGKKISQTATVSNTGSASINVTAASVSSGQFAVSGISMPLSLPVGQSSTFQVWFDPSAAGTVTGTLTVQTDSGVSSGQVTLSGVATTPPQQISLSSTTLNLGSAIVGTTLNGSLTLTNTGGANLVISLISVKGGPFGVSGITTPSTIVPGGSATMNVSFTPTTAGSDTGSISITSNDPNTPTETVALTGTGTSSVVAPTITTQPVNQTVTAGQTATFSVVAGGTAPLSYQWQQNGVNIAGATASSYTTPVTTTANSGSTFDVVVSNTAGNAASAKATLTVNPALVAGIQLSSNPINFGNDVVGSSSNQLLIITNTGTATLTISQVNETGSAFNVSGFTLPINVNAGQQTTISVAFRPTAVGAATGNISIVSNAPSSPTSVTLNGTGIASTLTLSINPTSLAFGNITTATTSVPQTVTISNTGNSSVAISQITLSGTGYSMTGGSAPVTLTPSQNLVLTIEFSPTAAGSVNGSISIVSNATGSPASVTLTGTGVAPVQHSVTLTWTASTSTVVGYNVYRGTTSGGPYVKINTSLITTLTYTDTDATLQSGSTYYYVATSVDSSGDESVNSDEVSALIP